MKYVSLKKQKLLNIILLLSMIFIVLTSSNIAQNSSISDNDILQSKEEIDYGNFDLKYIDPSTGIENAEKWIAEIHEFDTPHN